MIITLMKNDSLPQVINKTLTPIEEVEGQFTQGYGLMSTTIRLTGSGFIDHLVYGEANYAQTSGRNYYITNWNVVADDVVDVSLRLDALTTYKEQIKDIEVMLERASGDYRPGINPNDGEPDVIYSSPRIEGYITDTTYPTTGVEDIEDVYFDYEFSGDEEDGLYVLLTSQTGYSSVGSG